MRKITLIALIAATLDDRGATDAADLVRDTDPDDDLWNNYIGPMLDSIEDDYTRMARELRAERELAEKVAGLRAEQDSNQ